MKYSYLAIIPALIAGAFIPVTPASAGCHLIDCVENVYVEPQELTHQSCETLWILRNSVFKDAKYCFKSARASAWFNNDGCLYSEQDEVPLNDYQRHNVDLIKSVEANRC